MIRPDSTILFQGDSITDAGRHRDVTEPNLPAGLGFGYAARIAERLLAERPADNLKFLNRGISGHRVVDLYARWKVDAVNLKPDILSILIGVNDTWHEMMSGNGVELDRYETVYRLMLAYTRQKLPDVQLVLCEPFVLLHGVVTEAWVEEIAARQEIVRRMAREFNTLHIPFQTSLNHALLRAPAAHWTNDGVHLTAEGHALLAQCWLDAVLP